jgi:hypothetical protein
MARKFLTPIDLGKNEIQNPVAQNLASAPGSPVKGLFYFNSTDNILYWWNGSQWVAAQGGAGAVPADTVTTQAFADAPVAGASALYSRGDHKHGMPAHDNAAHSAVALSALGVPTGPVSFNNQRITSVGTPSAGTDAVTKDYADNMQAGLSWKDAVRAASTANVNTAAPGASIDGVTMAAGDRVLLKDQSTGGQNGIWIWNSSGGAMTRASDADTESELLGATVFVTEGTANADKAFTMTTNAPITVGTTTLTWVQFGAGTSYSAGAGLTLTGSTFDVVAANGSIVVAADNIQVGFAGSGSAVTAAKSDHNHDGTYTKKFSQDCAANVLTTVTHNFNTRDVKVEVYRTTTPWDTVDADVERPSLNAVDVRFATAPSAAQYRIVVAA